MNPEILPPTPGVRLDMNGRTALITGGSRGLGLAIGKRFLEAGAAVILVARREDPLFAARDELAKLGLNRVTVHAGDMADRSVVEGLCAALNERSIDVLVNNAGTSNRGPFEEQSDAIWQSDIDLKLFAAIRLARFLLPGMRARRWGRILNVVSINGKTPGGGGAPTAVTRAAGIALTKVLANEYGKDNILVNALCTGVIESDQVVRRHEESGNGLTLEEHMRMEAKPIPLGRLGTAQEYANVALFLASDAGSYITGTAINIDGGLCRVV
jgi:NAD(P)-dependent dehydrogenase (short-subunit alcohol dehydrogenase family)